MKHRSLEVKVLPLRSNTFFTFSSSKANKLTRVQKKNMTCTKSSEVFCCQRCLFLKKLLKRLNDYNRCKGLCSKACPFSSDKRATLGPNHGPAMLNRLLYNKHLEELNVQRDSRQYAGQWHTSKTTRPAGMRAIEMFMKTRGFMLNKREKVSHQTIWI